MAADSLLTALALVLVVEGLLPALSPALYRRAFRSLARLPGPHLRLVGLSSMIAGAVMLTLVH